jgi:hypothetical protein
MGKILTAGKALSIAVIAYMKVLRFDSIDVAQRPWSIMSPVKIM